MPGEPPLKRRVTATLDGFPAWVLIEYEKVTKESEKGALAYIIKRWTELDPTAQQHHITLDEFNGGGELVPFRKGE
jgi:hypothetical protein